MQNINLSKRLKKVASYIPRNSKIADIGSDHAYLPCYALQNGLINEAIAGEVNEGPYLSAVHTVEECQLSTLVQCRLGNGLSVISKGEVDCIIIAGMGGELIKQILENGKSQLSTKERLILQPNVASDRVRTWLDTNDWSIIDESILEEDQHIYEIIVAEKSKEIHQNLSDIERLMGPYLIKEKNDVFIKKWAHEADKMRKIIESLKETTQTENILNKIELFRERENQIRRQLK
ncbi:tRNA (adenine(22)-N(1))-methyltransferase [Terrilactibacillus laevilacticus]|uniref:tRNA (adenine(22)-N(1))-methyltransferase n=1 Tax=Terrilactibacillus laevilacticus TaxID=1380157 RepID=UPI00114780AE|nr:tRNA (adenine(22)-N(1))-methyltransferase TrmK [Terrilactibacillus laevilacticus]